MAWRSIRRRGAKIPPEWLGVATVLLLFQLVPGLLVSERYMPRMSEILAALWTELGKSEYWMTIADTLQGWAIGLGLATAIGIPLGILIGSSWILFHAMRPPVEFLRPIPSVAIIPLAVLTLGTGLSMKVLLVTYASLWPLLLNTIYGVRNVDPVLIDTARAFGIGRIGQLYRVTLPETMAYIATGLRISAATALILAVTAELVVGAPGIGRSISIAQQGGAIPRMYALIVTAGMLGWFLSSAFRFTESRMLRWHPAYRPAEGAS